MSDEMIILLKLSDNDTYIVGKLVEEKDDEIILEYPISIKMVVNSSGGYHVHTNKFMPFSLNNLVAVMKPMIVALSKPNHKVIGFYKHFLETYSKQYDNETENDLLGIKATVPNESTSSTDINKRRVH